MGIFWLVVVVEIIAMLHLVMFTFVNWPVLDYPFGEPYELRVIGVHSARGMVMFCFLAIAILAAGKAVICDDQFNSNRERRCLLYFACAIYIVLLVIDNAASVTTARRKVEPRFAVRFNALYCDARTARACLEGDGKRMLELMYGNATTMAVVESGESVAAVAASIWSRCRSLPPWRADETESTFFTTTLKTDPIHDDAVWIDLFSTRNDSSAVDTWCGNVYHRNTTLIDADQRALPSPFASRRKIFVSYTHEWTTRMTISNVMLGIAVACLLFAILGLKVADKLES